MVDHDTVSVLCVDDNEHVAHAIRLKLSMTGGFDWKGWLPDANTLIEIAEKQCPNIVLLDLDMPGKDAFEAIAELQERCPDIRVVVFTGHVRHDLIDRAVHVGAWAYVSKSDSTDALVSAIAQVAAGEFALSPLVKGIYHS